MPKIRSQSTWSERFRWRLFFWLVPRLDVAAEKRRLERVAQEFGATRSPAKKIANEYFDRLHRT